jgi:hypothetical protein
MWVAPSSRRGCATPQPAPRPESPLLALNPSHPSPPPHAPLARWSIKRPRPRDAHAGSQWQVMEAQIHRLRGVLRVADPIFMLRRDTRMEPSLGGMDPRLVTFFRQPGRRHTFLG